MRAGLDHTLHAEVEGHIAWSKDVYSRTKRSRVHIVPQEMPNTEFPTPPPFAYHPELYPELAQANPEPTNFTIHKKVSKKRSRNPLKTMGVSAVAPEDVQRVEVPSTMNEEVFAELRHGYKTRYQNYN